MKKRRTGLSAAAALLTAALLAGCGGQTTAETGTKEKPKSAAEQQTDALSINVWAGSPIEQKLTEQFPEIAFDFRYYDGINITSNLQMKVQHQDIEDIFFGTLPLNAADAKANLIDLSGYQFCDNYEASILNQYDIDGGIYQLPNALSMRCIVYNQKMFREHGWEEPQNFEELTALCRQIRTETDDITPIVFGGAATGYYFTTMTTYAQTEYLYTPEGAKWEREYLAGRAKAADGFGVGIRMVQELIDAGAFDFEKNDGLWDGELFEKRMDTGEAAMEFIWGAQNSLFGFLDENKDLYKVMPFRNYEGDAFIGTAVSYNIGLSKALEQPGCEKKLENALRVMEWFSTEEGQQMLSSVSGSIIYPIKNVQNEQAVEQFRDLWYDNLDGIKAPMLYTGYEDIMMPTAEYIIEAVKGAHDLGGLAEKIDEVHKEALEQNANGHAAFAGSFARDFTHEETVQFVADLLQAKGSSDLTLVSDGERTDRAKNVEGVHSKFYEGRFLYGWSNVILPGGYDYEHPVVQMTLTGEQIRTLLNEGKNMVLREDSNTTYAIASDETAVASARYDYYWSGIRAEQKNGTVENMTLSSGETIKPDKTYTVSFARGDYMDTTAAAGHPVDLEYSVYDAFTEYLGANSPAEPPEVLRENRRS